MSNNNEVQQEQKDSLNEWKELIDPKTQRVYYHNLKTGEVSWDRPSHKSKTVENGKKTLKKTPKSIYTIYKALRAVKSVEGLPESPFSPKEVFLFE